MLFLFLLLLYWLLDRQWPWEHVGAGFWPTLWLALLGTFVGAYAAFKLESRARRARQRALDIEAGRAAQFALLCQLSLLTDIARTVVNPVKGDPDAWLTMRPAVFHAESPRVDTGKLGFLLAPGSAQLPMDLFVAEQNFFQVVGLLRFRNEIHFGMQQRAAIVGDKAALDVHTTTLLKNSATELTKGIDAAVERHEKVIHTLGQRLRELFPGELFIRAERLDKGEPSCTA